MFAYRSTLSQRYTFNLVLFRFFDLHFINCFRHQEPCFRIFCQLSRVVFKHRPQPLRQSLTPYCPFRPMIWWRPRSMMTWKEQPALVCSWRRENTQHRSLLYMWGTPYEIRSRTIRYLRKCTSTDSFSIAANLVLSWRYDWIFWVHLKSHFVEKSLRSVYCFLLHISVMADVCLFTFKIYLFLYIYSSGTISVTKSEIAIKYHSWKLTLPLNLEIFD